MKTALKVFLFGSLLVSGFYFAHFAKATTISSQGGTTNEVGIYGSGMQQNVISAKIASDTPSSAILQAFKINISADSYCNTNASNTYPSLYIYTNPGNVAHEAKATKSIHDIYSATGLTEVTYIFTPILNLASSTIPAVAGIYITEPSECSGHMTMDVNNWMLSGQTSGSLNGSLISFPNPPFADGVIISDFQNWQACITIPSSTGISAYDVSIWYASTTPTYIDRIKDKLGYIPTYNKDVNNDCVILTKTQNFTPGDYHATAILYDQFDNQITQSDRLYFTISSGSSTPYAGGTMNIEAKIPTCQDTAFDVLGADFGKGFCTVMKFLFVPDQSTINEINSVYLKIQTKIPFSYLFEVQNILSQAGTGTTANIPEIKIQTSATSSIPNLNIPLFSSSTVAQATQRTGFSGLRTLANVLLYVGFAYMCYETAIHVMKKKGTE